MCSIKNKAGFKKQTRLMFLFYRVSGTAAVLVFCFFFLHFQVTRIFNKVSDQFWPLARLYTCVFFFFWARIKLDEVISTHDNWTHRTHFVSSVFNAYCVFFGHERRDSYFQRSLKIIEVYFYILPLKLSTSIRRYNNVDYMFPWENTD